MITLDTDPSTATKFINNFTTFLIDCDGVLWNGGTLIEGAAQTIHLLRSLGKKLFFVTNNSTKTRLQYKKVFEQHGIEVNIEEIYCTSYLVSEYMKSLYPDVKTVYVVGESGIVGELSNVGIKSLGSSADNNKVMSLDDFALIDEKELMDIGAVICGWDRSFNFYKLCYASLILQVNRNAKFIATNRDAADRIAPKRCIPGGGCMVSAIETSVGKKPQLVGKPSPWLVDWMVKKLKLDKSKMVMIGDRLDTDIVCLK